MTDRAELLAAYTRLESYIQRQNVSERDRQALADLRTLGAALASLLGPELKHEQKPLIDVPKRKIYR